MSSFKLDNFTELYLTQFWSDLDDSFFNMQLITCSWRRVCRKRGLVTHTNDILIYSKTVEEHIIHVGKVVQRVREYRMAISFEKSGFHVKTVDFLRYVLATDGVTMNQKKVESVKAWRAPASVNISKKINLRPAASCPPCAPDVAGAYNVNSSSGCGRTGRNQKLSPPATLRPADNPTVPLHPMHPPACYPFPDVLRLQSPSP